MIGFYILGSYNNNTTLMGIQLFLFVAFVICQFFYGQVSELYKIFAVNEGKSEFPARRILRMNVAMMIVFAVYYGAMECYFSTVESTVIYSRQ